MERFYDARLSTAMWSGGSWREAGKFPVTVFQSFTPIKYGSARQVERCQGSCHAILFVESNNLYSKVYDVLAIGILLLGYVSWVVNDPSSIALDDVSWIELLHERRLLSLYARSLICV